MIRLMKYLKPYIGFIAMTIMLLFVQAMCDLALPDYMSNIVNKGIQQGGIENAVPEALSKRKMDKLTAFMSPQDKDRVLDTYILVDDSSTYYNKYAKKYPALEKEPVYVRKEISKEEIDELNPVIGKSFIVLGYAEKIQQEAQQGQQFTAQQGDAEKQLAMLDEKTIVQAAAALIKAEYKALGMNTDKIQSKYIINTGIIMLLISLLGAACTVAVGFFASRTAAGLARDLRRRMFTKIESFSNTEFDKFSTASLITRTTNDITQIQMVTVMIMRIVFFAPILGIGGVIRALGKSVSMSWIIALAVIVLLGLILLVYIIAMPRFKMIQKLIDKLNLVTRENLSGMMVIRAFNTQKFEEKRFDKANQDLTDTSLFVNRVMACMFPAMTLIMNGVTLLIVWAGAHKISETSMQVGDMMAFMQYAMQIIFAFLMLSFTFIMIPRASVSAQRIMEVLDTEPVIIDPENPRTFNKTLKGIVEFKNVCFRYPGADEDVLKDISFTALPGKTTAFIGSTGAGKTTLINLILRFYDVTAGQILIDGVDIRDVTLHELRDKIGYVPQKASLFSGTIESNLRYADENASEDDIKKAAEIAQAMEFIKDKPEGFETEISQGGTNVSGGQKQRLSIARALVKKPHIYIFDDSFSALDFKTDAALRKALKEQTASSTVLIVAQRISTILNADQIIVLDEGKIVGKGTHKELMENCETYREIALSQLSKEELA